jgi:hypothetical protein
MSPTAVGAHGARFKPVSVTGSEAQFLLPAGTYSFYQGPVNGGGPTLPNPPVAVTAGESVHVQLVADQLLSAASLRSGSPDQPDVA